MLITIMFIVSNEKNITEEHLFVKENKKKSLKKKQSLSRLSG